MKQPDVEAGRNRPGPQECRHGGTVFVVYAPFGTDEALSDFPDGPPRGLLEHPLVKNLRAVAAGGTPVVALVDLVDQPSHLLRMPAGGGVAVEPVGKQDMLAPQTLAMLLEAAHGDHPDATLVLSIEGHGAGFLPDLDPHLFTMHNVTASGQIEWRLGGQPGRQLQTPFDAGGKPLVARGAPVLPAGGPTCPTTFEAMSTWGMAEALRLAGTPRLAVLNLNSCFNMSVELLHTVAPYAEYATGYCNYNFFSAGAAFPAVFRRLATAGRASAQQLAEWFAAENHQVLLEAGHEPTVAGTVALARMHGIAEQLDHLSDALLDCLRAASPAERPGVVEKIQGAIVRAQQYDSRPDHVLDAPDELTDLRSLAFELSGSDFGAHKVASEAQALYRLLEGIKQYGDVGDPWMAEGESWDFSSKHLAMNIFLPDPLRKGLWDWRSQYYLDVNPDPSKPRVQRHIIDFVKVTDWVDFLVEYHKGTPFIGLLPAGIPETPTLRSTFDPRRPGKPAVLRAREGRPGADPGTMH